MALGERVINADLENEAHRQSQDPDADPNLSSAG
jgi:hypothetical protein